MKKTQANMKSLLFKIKKAQNIHKTGAESKNQSSDY